jgi:N-acetylmuramic acid 6-phosphate etherase
MELSIPTAEQKAEAFLTQERAFRLGELLTESSHPKTRTLSQTLQRDLKAGIRMLQSVDQDISDGLDRLFGQAGFSRLAGAMAAALAGGHRVFFTGCGATGRLSILLEAAWREFFQETLASHPHLADRLAFLEDRCVSVMAGGDFALIKSVEGFEDFPAFGRRQLADAGVRKDDVVVAITEGGETPFVIGTAWEGLATGSQVFFVYNNPTDLLTRHVQRSAEVIAEPRITKLDLSTGPMAITGSTRMQATTAELLTVGTALEQALGQVLRDRLAGPDLATLHIPEFTAENSKTRFRQLLADLSVPQAVGAIADAVGFEEALYRQGGRVTYAADAVLLDVLTDTTERSPTFMVPAFRRQGDDQSPISWGFVKNPSRTTSQAWQYLLRREPRGLTWTADVYKSLDAPGRLQANPPALDNAEILRFTIGNEPDPSRTNGPDSGLVVLGLTDELQALAGQALAGWGSSFHRTALISIGPARPREHFNVGHHFHCPCQIAASPLKIWRHLAVKLLLNALSTATMARMGRVLGNAMVWVSPSNKKLIDRGCRLISQTTGCTYEQACHVLFRKIDEVEARSRKGEQVPSPVSLAIEEIGGQKSEVRSKK